MKVTRSGSIREPGNTWKGRKHGLYQGKGRLSAGRQEGLKIEESSAEGKVLFHIIDVLDDITDALDGLAEAQYAAEEEAEEVQEILSDIVEFFDVLAEDDDEDYDEDDDDLYEVICPECGENVSDGF